MKASASVISRWGFDPSTFRQIENGDVAQLAEQSLHTGKVAGSNPAITTKSRMIVEREKYTYKGIEFEKIKAGWIFNNPLPGSSLRWKHWCRFFEQEELDLLNNNSAAERKKQIQCIHNAIDRAYKDMPIFRGDIRDFKVG